MIFQQLRIGDYFRVPGINFGCVYRKNSSSSCTWNFILKPMRPKAIVVPLNSAQISKYMEKQEKSWQSF
jgi:hypothetical protein